MLMQPRPSAETSNPLFPSFRCSMISPLLLLTTFLKNFLGDRQRRHGVWPADIEGQVSNHLRGLSLRKAVVHRPIQVECDLSDLTGCDARTDCHEAPVTRGEIWAKPQVVKQQFGGVLHESGGHLSELFADNRSPLLLGIFVERQELRGGWREVVGADLPRGEHLLRDGDGRRSVPPAGVKGEMRDDFRNLARLYPTVEGGGQVVRQLDGVVSRYQRRECHNAP